MQGRNFNESKYQGWQIFYKNCLQRPTNIFVIILKCWCFAVCDIALFSQITMGPGVTVTGPLLPNTAEPYMCMDADFFVNGPETNMCDGSGVYDSTTAPSCERSKSFYLQYCLVSETKSSGR